MTGHMEIRVPIRRIQSVAWDDQSVAWDDLHRRVFGEFLEMPGLSLTLAQAARLFHLPEARCLGVLADLVDRGLLHMRPDGRYSLTGEAA